MSWYPGTIFEIDDQSGIVDIPVNSDTIIKPTFLVASSTDKGDESLTRISGDDFLKRYVSGNPSYTKHGIGLLQAVNIIKNGGELVFKRLVAHDAKLANAVVYGNIVYEEVTSETDDANGYLQKMDSEGRYITKNGEEETEVAEGTGDPVYYDGKSADGGDNTKLKKRINIFFTTKTFEGVRTINELTAKVEQDATSNKYGTVVELSSAEGSSQEHKIKKTKFTIPLFIITDIGRGESIKKFYIVPDYESSKSSTYCKYNFVVKENNSNLEAILFSMNPDVIYSGNNISIESAIKRDSSQVNCKQFSDNIIKFYEELAKLIFVEYLPEGGAGVVDSTYLGYTLNYDIINGKTKKRIPIDDVKNKISGVPAIQVHTLTSGDTITNYVVAPEKEPPEKPTGFTVIDLGSTYGNELPNGSYGTTEVGENGHQPTLNKDGSLAIEEQIALLTQFFMGQVDTVEGLYNNEGIFDVDKYKIDYCLDADYPLPIKRIIEKLADWREDFFYMEDMGTGKEDILGKDQKPKGYYLGPLTSYQAIEAVMDSDDEAITPAQSKFVGVYHNYWDEYDPYTKKQITVPITYDFSNMLVDFYLNGYYRPFAGILYNVIFPSVIAGTVNYIPKIVPDFTTGETINRKSDMCDLRVNYCSYIDDRLVLETLYTMNKEYSQLSFSNNVILVQAIIKAIRSHCPAVRYKFMYGEDLENYKNDVQDVLNKYTSFFDSLEFEYVADPLYESNKIFYAIIKVKFKNFIQTEKFKIIALQS